MHQHDAQDPAAHHPNGPEHAHRELSVHEEPMDAAHQSLSDALRASFGILKLIMIVLVVLYLFSNVRRVDSHEQALVLRLGRLLPTVYDPGLVWAFPFPIDEIVPLPTQKSNELTVKSHTFHRTPDEIGKDLQFIVRGSSGLNPSLDGALLTADLGLVHVQWKVFYKIVDLRAYVSNIHTRALEAADTLIRRAVETAGIQVASERTAAEMIRTGVERVQSEMLLRVNERLSDLDTGIVVSRIEMFEPTPPIPVRGAFDNTQRAENTKERKIQDAHQERTRLLNEAAGEAHVRLIQVLDEIDALERVGPIEPSVAEELHAKLDRILLDEVEGRAGRMIENASSYLSRVVAEMQSDLELYRTLVPEYRRTPELLIERLWQSARESLLADADVTKVFRPPGARMWLKIPYDPEQARAEESQRLQEQEFDPSSLRPKRFVPIGPGMD